MSARAAARRLAWCAALLLTASCSWFRGAAIPILFERHAAAGGAATGLVVLLPGIGDGPSDFLEHGVVDAIRRSRPDLDVVAVDANLAYYVRGLLTERVHQDIVRPRRDRYDEVWVVGISLGGLGAMCYAADYPHVVDGVVLVAPFLGDDEVVDEVRAAGGVRSWQAPVLDRFDDPMRRLAHVAWTWARGVAERSGPRPDVYLGYGSEDRFAAAHVLLADALREDHVLARPGGHDWSVWTPLLGELVASALRRGAAGAD